MEVWTEVLDEDLIDVHVGTREVLIPINDGLEEYQIRDVLEQIEKRAALKAARENFLDQMSSMREQMEERREARERLKEAGYEESEIPL